MPSILCIQCGKPRPEGSPVGMCPNCLLSLGVEGDKAEVKTVREQDPGGTAEQEATVRVVDSGSPVGFEPGPEQPGSRLGRYRLLEPIGQGGFGTVWMAEQLEPVRRKVALKIIKLGMDTREVVARFEAERQALALMDHPNIARVFDGGTSDSGRPYFVMELVRGVRITDYCDACRLGTRERLELFLEVCQAVQHAHQKGVIHRDLKPSNVLVTEQDGRAVPKVIDFGIAKATGTVLTEKTLFTRFNQFIGTPAYMSPEQAGLGGLDIDTRSDVYSLGVVLYELLTGRAPFSEEELRKVGLDEILRTIREKEPPKPSTRVGTLNKEEQLAAAAKRSATPALYHRTLRGELDWIVMKCLEKDRGRRYETASGLARDLECFLNDEAVSAAAPGAAYRIAKIIRRHRKALAALVTVGVLLTAASVVSLWQAVRASRFAASERLARNEADANARGQANARADADEQRQRAEGLLVATELERVEDLFEKGEAGLALAHLGSVVRREPTNRVAASRLISALGSRDFALPIAPPLQSAGSNVLLSPWFTRDGMWRVAEVRSNLALVFDGMTGRPVTTLEDWAPLFNVEVSSGGTFLACTSTDRLRVWSLASGGRPLFDPVAVPREGGYLHFAPDGRMLYLRFNRQFTFYEPRTGRIAFSPPPHFGRVLLEYSPDGTRFLLQPAATSLEVRDALNGRRLTGSFDVSDVIESAVFLPNGRHVLVAEGGRQWAWDTANNARHSLPSFPGRMPPGRNNRSPDGTIAVTLDRAGRYELTETWTGRRLGGIAERFRDPNFELFFRFSPDGQRVALQRPWNSRQAILDARTGEPWPETIEFSMNTAAVRFSPNGRSLLVDTVTPEARPRRAESELFTIEPGRMRHGLSRTGLRMETNSWDDVQFGEAAPVFAASPAYEFGALLGDRLAMVTGTNSLLLLDLASGRPAAPLLAHPTALDLDAMGFWSGRRSIEISPSRRYLAVDTEAGLVVWDLEAKPVHALALTGTNESCAFPLDKTAFSSDGRFIATTTPENVVRIWSLPEGKVTVEFPATNGWFGGFVPHRPWVFLYDRTGAGRFFDATNGRLTRRLAESFGSLHTRMWTPDGRRLVAEVGDRRSIACWDIDTGAPAYPPVDCGVAGISRDRLMTGPNRYGGMRLAPNGLVLAYAPLASGSGIGALEIETGRIVAELHGAFSLPEDAVFAADGETILARDGAERPVLWRFRSGATAVLTGDSQVKNAVPDPSGRGILTIGRDNSLRLWDAMTGHPLSETITPDVALFQPSTFTFLGFSPDGQTARFGAATAQGELVLIPVPFPRLTGPAPEWLPRLAEAVGRRRRASDGSVAFVPSTNFLALRWELLASPAGDDYTRWARWFLSDRATRAISPDSPVSMPAYLRLLAELDTVASLRQATRLVPSDALSHARLARRLVMPPARPGISELNEAMHRIQHARSLAPGDPDVESMCAEAENWADQHPWAFP